MHCSSRPLTLSATYIRDLAQDGNAAIIGYDSGTAPKVIDLTSAAVTSISNPAANTLGIAITLEVTDEDIELILNASDANADDMIQKSELLPALARWEELASVKVEDHKCGCCTGGCSVA